MHFLPYDKLSSRSLLTLARILPSRGAQRQLSSRI